MSPRLYTVTEIAEEICRADRLALSDHTIAHSQVRNAVRRGMLMNGATVDKRGTQAFPALEIYRARLLNALADLSVDIVAMRTPLSVAFANTMPDTLPDRCEVGGAFRWEGFKSIVDGVAAGERWLLEIKLFRPGYLEGKRVAAAFVLVDDRDVETEQWLYEMKGTGAPQIVAKLDLNALFAGLPSLTDA